MIADTLVTYGNEKVEKMNCWHCSEKLIWGGDHDLEDYGVEGVETNLSCSNDECETYVIVTHIINNYEEELYDED